HRAGRDGGAAGRHALLLQPHRRLRGAAQELRHRRAGRPGQRDGYRGRGAGAGPGRGLRHPLPARIPHRRGRIRVARPGARAAPGRIVRPARARMTLLPHWVSRRVLVAFAAVLALLSALPFLFGFSAYTQNLVTLTFLTIAAALAWNWLGGYLGQVS